MTTRRHLLKLSAASLLAPSVIDAEPAATRIIDTHTHFFDPTRPQGVPWPAKGSPLYRPVYPKDWLAVATKHGVRETVVVEASPWVEDNDWILNLAEKDKSILGLIGNVSPDSPEFEKHLRRLSQNPLFRGIRLNGDTVVKNLDSQSFIKSMQLLADLDLVLDLNGLKDPAVVAQLADKVSSLTIVINHCGNCGDAQKLTPVWKDGMAAAAKARKVWCKVSALIEFNGLPWGKAPTDSTYYTPVLDHLWQHFGADRLIYASNWPVSERGGSYDLVMQIVSDYLRPKGSEVCEKFFWKNSLAAYQWKER